MLFISVASLLIEVESLIFFSLFFTQKRHCLSARTISSYCILCILYFKLCLLAKASVMLC